jgi:diacylglycerol kinase (ATP)
MRATAIFGLGSSPKNLAAFQQSSDVEWQIGMPASSTNADAVLLFGGDGTIHRHLASFVKLQLPVLIVPCGSGNDFARALGLRSSGHALRAWRKFLVDRSNIRAIDLGTIAPLSAQPQSNDSPTEPGTSHYFCCVAGLGLDGEVASRANRLPRWLRGHGGYVLSLPPALVRFAPFPAKISAHSENDEWNTKAEKPLVLAAFANAPVFGGGMKIAPKAQLDDGLLDICLVSDMNAFKLFCLFPTVYFGRHLNLDVVEYFKANRARVETEHPFDIYADGEFVCRTPVEVGVAARALPVVVP